MLPGVAEAGVYDVPVDERLLVHDLEHGYVNVYHDPGARDADVEQLRRLVRDQLDGFPRIWAPGSPRARCPPYPAKNAGRTAPRPSRNSTPIARLLAAMTTDSPT